MRPWNIALVIAASFILGVTGCDKIPTWGELTGGQQPAPAPAPTTPAPAAPVVNQPVKPAEPSAEEVIAKFKVLKSHEISDASIASLTDLNGQLDQVTEINADGSKVTSAAFGSIEKLTNLRQLRLSSTRVDNEACKKIAMLSNLEVLALTDTAVDDVGVAMISALPNLKHLELTRCKLSENGFNAIGQLPAIEYIALESTNLTNEKLKLVCNAKTLREFWISKNQIDDFGLVALSKLDVLQRLEISYSRVTGEGLMHASKGGGLKNLAHLSMYACPLNLLGAKAVSQIKSIEILGLGEITHLNDEVLFEMIKGMKKLRHLNLNKCSNLNGQGLAGLKGNKEFEELIISQCPAVGDGVIPFLKTVKSLKLLVCGGTAITPNGISALKASIPDLKVN